MTAAKYFSFGGDRYYPGGGAEDFISVYESLEHAFIRCEGAGCEWMHIAVLDDGELNILAVWSDNFSFGPGHWWRVGEYPNAQYAKKWQDVIGVLSADYA